MVFAFFDLLPEDKVDAMKAILKKVGMPKQQQSTVCAYTMLALLSIRQNDEWTTATSEWIRIHDIIRFCGREYGVNYAENSRETIRKQALHHFRTAALIEDNGKPTNSPAYRYKVTPEFLNVIKNLHDESILNDFLVKHGTLIQAYASKKEMKRMPVNINGDEFTFSVGKHNQLQKAILEEFAPRFAPHCTCLYVGDSDDRDKVKNVEELAKLGFEITEHDKMPDVVLYREDKDWLYFVEAVTSVGPMDPKRLHEIGNMTQGVKSGKIYVTAFLDKETFKHFYDDLAWETEVWIASDPNHMIHLNGDKFMGPR